MLDCIFKRIAEKQPTERREDGVAFLRSIATLYNASSVDYLAVNINNIGSQTWMSCHYSNRRVEQFHSPNKTLSNPHTIVGMWADQWRWHKVLDNMDREKASEKSRVLAHFWVVALQRTDHEHALFSMTIPDACFKADRKLCLSREWTILGTYFHSHILRLNGHDSSKQLIVSAKELDCLRWTAAGKTAWEASKILGISERTVRFHLNAAREKLSCATTTQAVAKAVARQLI